MVNRSPAISLDREALDGQRNGLVLAEPKDRQDRIDAVRKALDEVRKVDCEALARADELGPRANFSQAVPHFQRLRDVFVELQGRDITPLPSDRLQFIIEACTQFQNLVQKVKGFDINSNNPVDATRSICNQVASAYDNIAGHLIVPLAYTASQQTNYQQIEREAKGHNAELKAQAQAMKEFIAQATKDGEQALAAVKQQAAQAGVSTNAVIFNEEAAAREKSSRSWLKATVALTSATALATAAGLALAAKWTPAGPAEAIHFVISKVLFLSVLTAATVWCARNYRAQKHNETLNRHRAHALMTFQAFVEGTAAANVKDAVLVQASHAAFQGRPTGYEAMGDTTSQGVAPIVEAVAKAGGKAIAS